MKENILAVRKMQIYIEEHLDQEITLEALSKYINFSPSHCGRLFTSILNMSPAKYVRRLRLAKAALKLRDENIKIIDIALELNYNSPDSFTRAFFQEFGLNPKEYSLNHQPITLFTPYQARDIDYERKWKIMESKNVFIQVININKRKVIIKRGIKAEEYFAYCEEVGCDVWGVLLSIKGIGEPFAMWLPKYLIKENTSEYVQGIEVPLDYNGAIPQGYEIVKLEQSQYLMFQSEKFNDEDYGIAINEIWKAIEKYDPATIGYNWDDNHPRIQLEPRGERGYIELVPIKRI